jgi:hypothetical protein
MRQILIQPTNSKVGREGFLMEIFSIFSCAKGNQGCQLHSLSHCVTIFFSPSLPGIQQGHQFREKVAKIFNLQFLYISIEIIMLLGKKNYLITSNENHSNFTKKDTLQGIKSKSKGVHENTVYTHTSHYGFALVF